MICYNIIECIKLAKRRLLSAECKFTYAVGDDVNVAIAELNAAATHLNRLYKLAKEEHIVGNLELYKNDMLVE